MIPILLIASAFLAVGYFVGWFIGASQTPVVVALIPVAVGLLGSVTVTLVERSANASKLMDGIRKLQENGELPVGAAGRIESTLRGGVSTSFWLPALWSLGVVLFCVACYFGAKRGIADRVGESLPPIADLLRQTDDPQERPTLTEFAYLHELRWRLASLRCPTADVTSLFNDVINPLFEKSNAPTFASQLEPPNPWPTLPRPARTRRVEEWTEPGKTAPPHTEQIDYWLSTRCTILKGIVERIATLKIDKFGPHVPTVSPTPPMPGSGI